MQVSGHSCLLHSISLYNSHGNGQLLGGLLYFNYLNRGGSLIWSPCPPAPNPENIWQCLETLVVVILGGEGKKVLLAPGI